MRKQEIKIIKEDLKKLIDAEIEWSENNTSGISHDYDIGFIAGLKQIRNNFVDKWTESLKELK